MYKQTGPSSFSSNGRFLAIVVDYRLVIREVATLKVALFFLFCSSIYNLFITLSLSTYLLFSSKNKKCRAIAILKPSFSESGLTSKLMLLASIGHIGEKIVFPKICFSEPKSKLAAGIKLVE